MMEVFFYSLVLFAISLLRSWFDLVVVFVLCKVLMVSSIAYTFFFFLFIAVPFTNQYTSKYIFHDQNHHRNGVTSIQKKRARTTSRHQCKHFIGWEASFWLLHIVSLTFCYSTLFLFIWTELVESRFGFTFSLSLSTNFSVAAIFS